MLLVQFISENYWSIENVFYENQNQYTPAANQKIIQNHNWIFKQNGEAEVDKNLIWDDKNKQVILFPENLKVDLHKIKILKECRLMLENNLRVLDPQVLQSISTKIKNATKIKEIDDAKNEIKSGIDAVITGLGF